MKKGYFHQFLACLSSGLSIASCLFSMNFTAFAVPDMEKDPHFKITPREAILVGSIVPFMGVVGNIVAGISVDQLGRRITMLAGSIMHIIGCILVAIAPTASLVLVGRGVTGVAFTVSQIPSMIYGTEVVHPSGRDRLNGVIGFLATMGSMIPFLIGNYISWRSIALLGAIIMTPSVFIILLMPESPVFLMKNEKHAKAKESLNWFRDSPEDAKKELKKIEESIKQSQSASTDPKAIFKAPYRNALVVSVLLLVAQQLVGITVLMAYINQIVTDLGLEWTTGMSLTITTINLGANFTSAEINSRIDRKRTLLCGSVVCVLIQLSIAVLFYLNQDKSTDHSTIILSLIFLFFAVFNISLGPIAMVYIGEGIPTRIRGPASAICFTINTIFIGFALQLFKPLVLVVGYHSLFLFFALSTALVLSFVYPRMLETRGKTVSEIDDYYSSMESKKTE